MLGCGAKQPRHAKMPNLEPLGLARVLGYSCSRNSQVPASQSSLPRSLRDGQDNLVFFRFHAVDPRIMVPILTGNTLQDPLQDLGTTWDSLGETGRGIDDDRDRRVDASVTLCALLVEVGDGGPPGLRKPL